MLCRAFSRGCAVTSNRSRLQAERKCSKPPCIAGRLSLCGQRGLMDKLQKCAKAFENLLEIQYRIIIGRKGKTVELVIGFSKLDFHHLMGLGKLKDLRIAKQNRGSVFDEIITGNTTYEALTKSRGFFTVVHAGRFLSCQYPLPCREAGICLFSLNRFARLVNAQCAIFRQNRPDFPLSRASGFL